MKPYAVVRNKLVIDIITANFKKTNNIFSDSQLIFIQFSSYCEQFDDASGVYALIICLSWSSLVRCCHKFYARWLNIRNKILPKPVLEGLRKSLIFYLTTCFILSKNICWTNVTMTWKHLLDPKNRKLLPFKPTFFAYSIQ